MDHNSLKELKESMNPLEYKQMSKWGKKEISSIPENATNKYRRMMELGNRHQWMLKLESKNLMRNKILSLKVSLHRLLFNYKEKNNTVWDSWKTPSRSSGQIYHDMKINQHYVPDVIGRRTCYHFCGISTQNS